MAYSIEEEQEINQLKDWWKENGKTIIVAFILGVGGMFGWRYWQAHQAEQIAQASAQYDALINSVQQDEQAKKANIEQFVQANSKTTYAVFALLDEAKKATEKQDFSAAEANLNQALTQSQDEVLTSIIALRLSAVQFQLGQLDNALTTLNQVKGESFNARKAILTGDIQVVKGDKVAAKNSFEQAQQMGSQLEQQMAKMKLNNL
ncbi:TPA: YfgM family protein [Haemophilus influenzae]|uniref:YfgM family protein n=1 Tax=Haemophilus influenzae TaxID=727 RepID=UPI000D0223D6|nr:YfgM family protein [Haemophilus influenzae]MCK8796255.1 YfgM family protein [Haemophilus influenzae]MCK8800617.1 YfgM family protein [Haemophilus influenzae]MCK8812916.1 YfgM family protein [Haemophilus influenzae]MCK8849226.1 YfgM family protein [Haemophilus influenzae]MCK8892779.1 YfgM family protein [Haemophilus influenzae]